MSELFPAVLKVSHDGVEWTLPRDAAMVLPDVGRFGKYAVTARACDLMLYHSREQNKLYLLLPDGDTDEFRGADIAGYLEGYAACLTVIANMQAALDAKKPE